MWQERLQQAKRAVEASEHEDVGHLLDVILLCPLHAAIDLQSPSHGRGSRAKPPANSGGSPCPPCGGHDTATAGST
eukprot:9829554-Lingulodinium_polyedra.AAC.1